jgi:hypothetical protein
MFRLVPQDGGEGPLLKSDHPLTSLDVRRVSERLAIQRQRVRKRGLVAARPIDSAASAPGDWLVTALDDNGHAIRNRDGRKQTSVIAAERFAALYGPASHVPATEAGDLFERRDILEALRLPGAFDIVSPQGERQQGTRGWLLLDGGEVSAITDELFSDGYVVLQPPASDAPWT